MGYNYSLNLTKGAKIMYQTINKSQFIDAFSHAGRKDQFTYEAKSALYDYLEGYDNEIELDVIALCCEFIEYNSIEDYLQDYTGPGIDFHAITNLTGMTQAIERNIEAVYEYIQDRTQLIKLESGGFIIAQY